MVTLVTQVVTNVRGAPHSDFSNAPQHKISRKSVQWSRSMQTDKYDEAYSRSLQLYEV
jgi:hypothetical protein